MEHRIQVLSVRTNLKNRTITLTCSSDIDEDTVSAETIYLSRHSSEGIVPLIYECDQHQIIMTLDVAPVVNEEYNLVVTKGVESIVGEPLEPVKDLKIVFESEVVTSVNIISPDNFATVKNDIDISWSEIGDEDKKTNIYQLQIGTEKSFFNIIVDSILDRTTNTDLKTTINIQKPGQYFMRMRAIKDDDYGVWSKVQTFTIPGAEQEPVPNPQPEEKERPSLPQITDLTKKDSKTEKQKDSDLEENVSTAQLITDEKLFYDDEVPESFELEFDIPINIDNASFTIKRRDS